MADDNRNSSKHPTENFSQGPWLGLYALTHHPMRTEIARCPQEKPSLL